MIQAAPPGRVRTLNRNEVRPDGKFVLYWMVAQRRTRFNFALQHAVAHAQRLGRPLLVLEALRCDYRWASDRLHRFVLDGMTDNEERFRAAGVRYLPYVERRPGEGQGLLEELGRHASVVVTDDFPAFGIPRWIRAGAAQVPAALEAVDSNGLLPLSATDRAFPTAYAFRRFLQRALPEHLAALPAPDPLARLRLPEAPRLPGGLKDRWPAGIPRDLSRLPIDHTVAPVDRRGGATAGGTALRRFIDRRLDRYAEERNHPDLEATSGLSPYLHFGHVSSHEVCLRILRREDWSPDRLADKATGSRAGWWGVGASAEAFLDQIVTWRELGFNMCRHDDGYDRYDSLPPWARRTLEEHALDPRARRYDLGQFENARTHDKLWNAAQRELRRDGRIHNYLRMLWGKKILEWTDTPREALDVMIELNDRFALDGRDPNSYSGIFWVLGRYDRPWGPERPIFGKIRYMTSANTMRKLKLARYLEHYGDG